MSDTQSSNTLAGDTLTGETLTDSAHTISFDKQLGSVDWDVLRQDVIDDGFHNGRSSQQLRESFENSRYCVMAFVDKRCIGKVRALSDGVGNAYVVDLWTQSAFRNTGTGKKLMQLLLEDLQGQHVYLQTDDAIEFYRRLGFAAQPEGLSLIVGDYLQG